MDPLSSFGLQEWLIPATFWNGYKQNGIFRTD